MKKADRLFIFLTWASSVLSLALPGRGGAAPRMDLMGMPGSEKPLPSHELRHLGSEIRLAGSRGEVLNFQLKVSAKGCEPLKVSDLVGHGRRLVREKIRLFLLPPFVTRNASYSGAPIGPMVDPVVPLAKMEVCPDGSKGPVRLWGEVEIPRAFSPGEYLGKIELGNPGNRRRVGIMLKVWKMTIPERVSFPAYSELSSWNALKGHFGKWHAGEGRLAKIYHRVMAEHRFYPLRSDVAVPKPADSAGDRTRLDLRSAPSQEDSFYSVVIQDRPEWALFDFPPPRLEWRKSLIEEYLKGVERSIQENHWKGRAMTYLWDEPNEKDFGKIVELGQAVRKFAPSLRILVTATWHPVLAPYVDIWAPVMDQFDRVGFPAPDVYRGAQKKGDHLWWYVSCMSHGCSDGRESGTPDFVIDRPSVYIRAIPWLAKRYGVDAFLYYSMNNFYQYSPGRDPWKDLWDFTGNGDGNLFFPGSPGLYGLKDHVAIPSVRMKIWREASFDFEYLRWMEKLPEKPAWWPGDFLRLVTSPRVWSKDYDAYARVREKIGEYLNGLAGDDR